MTYSKRCPPILCTTLHHVSNVTSLRIDCRFNSTPHLFHIFALKLCSLTMRLCTFKRHLNCFRAASFGEKRLSPPPTAMPILLRCFFSTCSKKNAKKKKILMETCMLASQLAVTATVFFRETFFIYGAGKVH